MENKYNNYEEIAQKWYKQRPTERSIGVFEDNLLFRVLYESYQRIIGGKDSFDLVVARSKKDGIVSTHPYTEACHSLFKFYVSTYGKDGFGLSSGDKGEKRTVFPNHTDTEYTFDRLYSDRRQFERYFLSVPRSQNQKLMLAFIMHTCVSFLVDARDLENLLKRYGYYQLHVRNIHHLAVFAVLANRKSYIENRKIRRNPFSDVKGLYARAIEIKQANQTTEATESNQTKQAIEATEKKNFFFSSFQTQRARQRLFEGENRINVENYSQYIFHNFTELNARHQHMLSDFHKLYAVYVDTLCEDEQTYDYSLYAFLNAFSRKISVKKFREQMTSFIDDQDKHPTRQLMIILWMYDYCFSCSKQKTEFSNSGIKRIEKRLTFYNPRWANLIKNYTIYSTPDSSKLNLSQIVHEGESFSPRDFDGEKLISNINSKLATYGLPPLSAKDPFDFYFMALRGFTIQHEDEIIKITHREKRVKKTNTDTKNEVFVKNFSIIYPQYTRNVPAPLIVISELFKSLKTISGTLPLACSLYEQV